MEQEYRQPIGEATEKTPDVPEETTADASEIKEALEIILGDAQPAGAGRKTKGKPASLADRAKAFRQKLDRMETEVTPNE